MAAKRNKESVITFKSDASLLEALRNIPNRSEFIRAAILGALQSYCPLCRGTGVLTPNQKSHWDEFTRRHPLRECDECHEVHLSCIQEEDAETRSGPREAGAPRVQPRTAGRSGARSGRGTGAT